MFSLVKRTLIRGRSLLPETFLRVRQRRNCLCLAVEFAMFFAATVFAGAKTIIAPSCLLSVRLSRRHSGRPCLCKAQADNKRGSPQPPVRQLVCRVLRWSIWYFPPP